MVDGAAVITALSRLHDDTHGRIPKCKYNIFRHISVSNGFDPVFLFRQDGPLDHRGADH